MGALKDGRRMSESPPPMLCHDCFCAGSFQYGSGIISSLLLALSPLNAVESMAIMMFAGAALMVWLPPVSGALAKLGLGEH